MIMNAKLEGTDLPQGFSYRPYVPRKRQSRTATAGAVIVQVAKTSQIVHGDKSISWVCPACFVNEWKMFYDWYNETTPSLLTFEGYWGEVYEVEFAFLDEPNVRGRLFDVSGQFVVVEVTTGYQAGC